MHRSGSTTRASDEYYVVGMAAGTTTSPSGAGKGAVAGGQVRRSSSVGGLPESDDLLLPRYDPQSGVAKKDAARSKAGENAVHAIPLVLITCALVLWFFSSPKLDDVVNKDASILARIENMTIDGYSNDGNTSIAEDVSSAEHQNEVETQRRVLMATTELDRKWSSIGHVEET